MIGSPRRDPGRTQAFVRPAPALPDITERPRVSAAPPRPEPRRVEIIAAPVTPPGLGSYVVAIVVVMAMTGAVVAGGWISDAQPALLVGVVGVVEAILLGRAGIGRLEALVFGLPLCAAVVVPVTIGVLPISVSQLGWYHVVGEYAIQAFAGLLATGAPDFVNWAFLVGLGALVWACAYWLGWVAFREHRGMLAILPVLVVLAVNSLNAPTVNLASGAESSVGLPEVIAIFAAILLVGISELGGLAALWRWRRVPAMSGLRGRFTASLAVVAALVVVASLLLPPLTQANVVNFFGWLSGQGNGAGNGPGTSLIGFSPDVTPGGALVSNPRPVLTYYTDSGDPEYLAMVTDDTFSDGNWRMGFQGRAATSVPVKSTNAIPQDTLGLQRSPVTAHINLLGTSGDAGSGLGQFAPFPAEPYSLSVPSLASGMTAQDAGAAGVAATQPTQGGYSCVGDRCTDPALASAGTQLETVDSVSVAATPRASTVTATGESSIATSAQLEQAGTTYPLWVTQLFPTSPGISSLTRDSKSPNAAAQARVIYNLARQWTKNVAKDPYDEATAIQEELRGSAFGYTLTPQQAPAGTWPIVYFLTRSPNAYCQYFASAMGAMLWSLGIPARLVTGYGSGSTTASSLTASGQQIYTVSTSDAHVWVEVYFPSYGWVPFEPTAATNTGGTYSDFPRGQTSVTPGATSAGGAIHPKTSTPPSPNGHGANPAVAGPGAFWWGGAVGGVLAVVVALALLFFRWWRRPRSLAGVWRRLALAGHLAGVDRDPAETRPAYARRLARALGGGGPPLLAGELGTVAALSGKAEFAPSGLEAADRELWLGAWRKMARSLARLFRRRLLHRPPTL
jgi:transglutaminase-like putative cysteine protease